MPGDPRACRENAARCAELAVAAKAKRLKVMLAELSRSWEKLAVDLEKVLDTIEFGDLALRWGCPCDTTDEIASSAKPAGSAISSSIGSRCDAQSWSRLWPKLINLRMTSS
jgi:hypothetical protein